MSHHLLIREAQGDDRDWEIEHAADCPEEFFQVGDGFEMHTWTCEPGLLIATAGDEAIAGFDELGPGRWPIRVHVQGSDRDGEWDSWIEVDPT